MTGPDLQIGSEPSAGDIIDLAVILAGGLLACVLAMVLACAAVLFVWFLFFHSAQLFGYAEPGTFLDHLDRMKKHF